MKTKLFIILAVLFTTISCAGSSDYLTVGSFNVEWLGDGIDDQKNRSEQDYKNIAKIIQNIDADIICLQEIENSAALEKLLKYLPDYAFLNNPNLLDSKQNLAALYKKDISVKLIGAYLPIAVETGKTRPGHVFNAKKGEFETIIQTVHLKSTSKFDSTPALKDIARELRTKQAVALSKWADSITLYGSNKNFLIVGDFNDSPIRKKYPSLDTLYKNGNIKFLTDSLKSCRFANSYSIDHIVASKSLYQKYVAQSLFMYSISSQFNESEAKGISDHCPVIVKFKIK